MDRFYSTLGWAVAFTVLASVCLAGTASNFEDSVTVLWIAQLPLYAYITLGLGVLARTRLKTRLASQG
ncbi:MAG TPA: hypothetical protein VM029_07400 [Opitutaceae bacterium]|nr:hypothetical protein [Opitutaceae bacterium]